MRRQLWGEYTDDEKPNDAEKDIPVAAKRSKLEEMRDARVPTPNDKNVLVKVRNPLVTQTIEVMKQTEMLQSLIDTYSNKSGSSNYLLNPCQIIPEVDFPPENAADFVSDNKFAKPIWFIPPQQTRFTRAIPQMYPQLNAEVCRASLRKAACGQLRVAGFTDTADTALVLFADAIEEFVRNLMQQIREVRANEETQREASNEVDVKSLERAYFTLTNNSLTQVHNYFKHNLVARNRSEIAEFNGVLQEYDKLMKESQSMQKEECQEGGDFLNILEMPQAVQDDGVGSAAMLTMLEGQPHMSVHHHTGTFKDVFQTKPFTDAEASMHATAGKNPYNAETIL